VTRQGTVAITGASGFVGQYLSKWLLEHGHGVLALVRSRHALASPGVEVRQMPEHPTSLHLRAAFAGATSVVHLAGRAHVIREHAEAPLGAYRAANVELTRAALQAAVDAGCSTFVLASSVKAIGERNDSPWNEDSPAAPADPYGVSKLEAEALVIAEGARLGIRTVVLRFPLIYGPGMRANMLRLFRAVDRGIPLPFGAIANGRSLLFVGNAAAAVGLALDRADAGSGLYFVSDGQDLSTPELAREVAVALGRPARLVPVPPLLFNLAGRLGDGIASLVPWPLTSGAVRRLQDSLTVDITRIRARLGYEPPFSVLQGLALTASWYRSGAAEAAPTSDT
jgi:UDP-glucose 4-epimerase